MKARLALRALIGDLAPLQDALTCKQCARQAAGGDTQKPMVRETQNMSTGGGRAYGTCCYRVRDLLQTVKTCKNLAPSNLTSIPRRYFREIKSHTLPETGPGTGEEDRRARNETAINTRAYASFAHTRSEQEQNRRRLQTNRVPGSSIDESRSRRVQAASRRPRPPAR